jgi:hypothetical protein
VYQRQLREECKEELLSRNKRFKKCPKCMQWAEKQLGSKLLHCQCGYEFCFKCGEASHECRCRRREEQQSFFGDASSFFTNLFR